MFRILTRFGVLFLILLGACQSNDDRNLAWRYLPPQSVLEEGIVYKYYRHLRSFEKNEDRLTDIFYHRYQLTDKGLLSRQSYGTDMSLTSSTIFSLDDNSWELIQGKDECMTRDSILQPHYINFEFPIAEYHVRSVEDAEERSKDIFRKQIDLRDTIIDGKDGKIALFQEKYSVKNNRKETEYTVDASEVYVQNLGLLRGNNIIDNQWYREYELVETMSLEEFEIRQAKVPERVAYIDPLSAMDAPESFSTCEAIDDIADYYNGEPHAHLVGGKGKLRAWIDNNYDANMYSSESGYLTYRFVINCRGEAGRFTTEEADLDFQPKKFDPQLVKLFFNMLHQQSDWQATIINGQATDAYTYITFKLKDGEVIEFLP